MTLKHFLKDKSICIIGAHPDDIELGIGGTLNQLKELKPFIHVFSIGTSKSTEFYDSMATYGLEGEIDGWTERAIGEKLQLVRDFIYNCRHYDVFLTHSKYSQHMNHRQIGEAVDDIIKDKTIITWEEVHSGKNIPINMWNEINSDDLAAKHRALDCYKSQAKRPYFEGQHIATLAKYRGNQILKNYAEAFSVVRLVL